MISDGSNQFVENHTHNESSQSLKRWPKQSRQQLQLILSHPCLSYVDVLERCSLRELLRVVIIKKQGLSKKKAKFFSKPTKSLMHF
jgi:hypothetical protein